MSERKLSQQAACPRAARFIAIALFLPLALVSGGCGGDEGGDEGTTPPTATDTGGDETDTNTGGLDTASTSDAGATDDTGTEDTATADTGDDNCPGGFGCTCTESEECDSGYCIDGPDGQYCSKTCADVCPLGFKCVGTSVGSDIVNLCVPALGFLCNPCKKNAECVAAGHGGARCVDHGEAGAFCGAQCATDSECSAGYACKDITDVAGQKGKQCVLKKGACECSKSAIAKELSTVCYKSVGNAKCAGERTCLADGKKDAPPGGGLSACLAQTPAAEKCDGVDNDCDGDTDELTCDDKNDCTVDSCDSAKGCKFTNKSGPCDADGSSCTKDDACANGTCKPGPVLDCDDKNPCTKDTCDAKVGCVYANTAAPCNADDNPCTVADTCKAGKCQQGALKPCGSGQPCVKGACSIATGKCKFTDKDGFPCNDGDACSGKGTCKGETCKAAPIDCNDNNACTLDSCVPTKGCKHDLNKGTCDDGDACTTGDSCALVAGKLQCFPGKKQVCDDKNDCTVDSCDAKKGCVHKGAVDKTVACYSGKPGTQKFAPCKGGTASCKADGTLGKCLGEVVPEAAEKCGDKIDDNCNGSTEDGCGKQTLIAGGRLVGAVVAGKVGKKLLRGAHGSTSFGGAMKTTKLVLDIGFYRWSRGLK